MNQITSKTEKKWKKIEHRALAVALCLICVICLVWVGLDAQSSKVQYEINQYNQQISETQKKIQNLDAKIKSASTIQSIERKALAMGMVHFDSDQVIYIRGESEIQEFATALIESIY